MNISGRSSQKPSYLVAAAVALALTAGTSSIAGAAEEAAADELSDVVVTGSRIARRDYESLSPIVTVSADTLENRSSVGIESALNQLPQFTVAGNAQANSSASTPFPSATAAPGAATVNLRNLGTNRSLVLVDGRRVQPVNGNLVVDLNTIPSAAIESVEVISGGAAAVYGADAISGVVNLKLKKNFEGAQFDAQYGVTQKGDGEEYQLSGLLGSNYSDGRGNVMFGMNYANRGDIKSRDRSWVTAGWADPGTSSGGGVPGSSGLSSFICDATCRGSNPTLFALKNGGSAYVIDQNGNVFDPNDPLNAAHPYTGPLGGTSGFKIAPTGALNYFDRDNSYLSLPLERWSMFASTTFKFNDNLTFFTEGRFSETITKAHGANVGLFNIWAIDVPYNAAYDDPDSPTFGNSPTPGFAYHPVSRGLADLLNARAIANPTTSAWKYEGGVDWLPPYTTDTTSDVYQLISGLRGNVGFKDWSWEVYGSHGKSTVNAHLPESFLSLRNVQQLFSANQYGKDWQNPQIIAVAGHCTSGLPIFNANGSVNNTASVSQDCADYVTLRMNNVSTLKQEVVEGSLQGSLFDLPAGPLQFAAGVNYREENFRFVPDAAYNANQSTANVVNNIAMPLGVNGMTNAKEVFAEFAIPVLSNLPLIKKLEIDPGIRYSDYNTTGSVDTWKAMVDWQLNDWARFRGGFQRANRAPNITELFSPVGASQIDFNAFDACRNEAGSTPAWGNSATNPNRLNLQKLCQYLMVRDGAPPTIYEPGQASANNYNFNVFGTTTPFPFDLAVQGGNPNLDSERADTVTIGAVFRSPFQAEALRRLTFSVDMYKIDIKGAIAVPSHLTVYQQCMDAQYNSAIANASATGEQIANNSPYCALIRREYIPGTPSSMNGADRRFMASYVNLGGIKTSGIDVQLDWGANFGALGLESVPGSINVNVQYSHLDSYKVSPFPGGTFVENKGSGVNFVNRTFTTVSYNNGPISAGLRWQHLPSLNPPPGAAIDVQGVNAHDQVDLFGRWSVNERYELRFGIDNLFDADPEVVGRTRNEANPSASNNALGSSFSSNDTFGRRFFLGAKMVF